MKKKIAFLLCIFVFLTFTSCDNDSLPTTSPEPTLTTQAPTTQPTQTPASTTASPTQVYAWPTETYDTNCKLFIDGRELPNPYVHIDYDNLVAEVPLVTIVEACGGTAEWQSDTLLVLKYNGRKIDIDISQPDFGITVMPGTVENTFIRKTDGKEVIFDDNHARNTLACFLGKLVDFYPDNAIVTVYDIPPEHPLYNRYMNAIKVK